MNSGRKTRGVFAHVFSKKGNISACSQQGNRSFGTWVRRWPRGSNREIQESRESVDVDVHVDEDVDVAADVDVIGRSGRRCRCPPDVVPMHMYMYMYMKLQMLMSMLIYIDAHEDVDVHIQGVCRHGCRSGRGSRC